MSQQYVMGSQASSGNPLRGQSQISFNGMQSAQMPLASVSPSNRPGVVRPFTAPAHKHAHHLHSIPPREKSTRTLIIDHMLWVHGRTRFAQARAELGMTDRTGGPSSSNYLHRLRPENFEEDEEELSDGEDIAKLKAHQDAVGEYHGGVQEDATRRRDPSLAKNLNLRAESLEKVVTAMLNQPPTIEPKHGDDGHASLNPARPHPHPHTLPNGVRLRLALGNVINDLFARTNHSHHWAERETRVIPSYQQDFTSRGSQITASERCPPSYSTLLPALIPLTAISVPSQAIMTSPAYIASDVVGHTNLMVQFRSATFLTPHARSIYTAGASHSSMTLSRCFRHLKSACDICGETEVKSPLIGFRKGRVDSLGTSIGHDVASKGVHIGLERGDGITGWRDGSGIGSGLAKPGNGGSLLRRAPSINEDGSGSTNSLELIPRFLRLSALVAIELGNETGQEGIVDEDLQNVTEQVVSEDISIRDYDSTRPDKQLHNRLYDDALRPSTEWYMLLAGLLSRAVLEGYLTAGWKGTDAVGCLLSCGLRIFHSNGNEGKGDGVQNVGQESSHTINNPAELFEEFDPDELPTLKDAATILFPSLGNNFLQRKDGNEAEFEAEMLARLRMFLDVASSTTDLRTHMEILAQRYPVEPVERAAVRFCEAIAKWRGKPELETYKKSGRSSQMINTENMGPTSIAIESFVHSTPTSPVAANLTPRSAIADMTLRKPPIEKYFVQVQTQASRDSGKRRPRSPNIGRTGKRSTR